MRVLRIPASWMPECCPKRIITHWTAGGYRATDLDRTHYHALVEVDGTLVRGIPSIADNCPLDRQAYAAHTLNANGGAIGVAVCCMAGAVQGDAGRYPMTRGQWNALVWLVADLCRRYGLPVTPRTVLGHGEVERILGIRQKGKWDPMWLPFEPARSAAEVGDIFRRRVAAVV